MDADRDVALARRCRTVDSGERARTAVGDVCVPDYLAIGCNEAAGPQGDFTGWLGGGDGGNPPRQAEIMSHPRRERAQRSGNPSVRGGGRLWPAPLKIALSQPRAITFHPWA